jgi:hypothetical protein
MNKMREWLYIGDFRDTRDSGLLYSHNIDGMLQFAADVRQPDIVSPYVDVDDGNVDTDI